MARSLKTFIQRHGKSVTLRTYTAGAADVDYGEPTWTSADATIKAEPEVPKSGTVIRSPAGDEIPVDAVFYVADGDEPAMDPAVQGPRIIDEHEYEIILVGAVDQLGLRPLNCKKVA